MLLSLHTDRKFLKSTHQTTPHPPLPIKPTIIQTLFFLKHLEKFTRIDVDIITELECQCIC